MTGGAYLWAWDKDAETYRKVLVDANGKLIISDADPFTIAQATPENLKHVPHGYYAVGGVYKPFAVDADGVLQSALAALALGDLTDVDIPPYYDIDDGDFLYYDLASFTWKNIAHKDATTGVHGVGAGTVAAISDIAVMANLPTAAKILTITFIIDGGGSAITTGQKGHLEIPFACTLTAWTLAADAGGAIVIDVWKDTYANFPPTNNDAMPGAGKEPTIAATNQKAQDTDISDWTTVAIAAGDILAFNVDSCTTITRVTLSLKATKI